jgi:hypothetical protein
LAQAKEAVKIGEAYRKKMGWFSKDGGKDRSKTAL